MPAAKKPASKASKAKLPAKKPVVKRAPAKSRSATTVKKVTLATPKSFRVSKPVDPFFTFRITHQTVYWLILSVIVIGLAAWVLSINIRVQEIYDQIEVSSRQAETLPTRVTTQP